MTSGQRTWTPPSRSWVLFRVWQRRRPLVGRPLALRTRSGSTSMVNLLTRRSSTTTARSDRRSGAAGRRVPSGRWPLVPGRSGRWACGSATRSTSRLQGTAHPSLGEWSARSCWPRRGSSASRPARGPPLSPRRSRPWARPIWRVCRSSWSATRTVPISCAPSMPSRRHSGATTPSRRPIDTAWSGSAGSAWCPFCSSSGCSHSSPRPSPTCCSSPSPDTGATSPCSGPWASPGVSRERRWPSTLRRSHWLRVRSAFRSASYSARGLESNRR